MPFKFVAADVKSLTLLFTYFKWVTVLLPAIKIHTVRAAPSTISVGPFVGNFSITRHLVCRYFYNLLQDLNVVNFFVFAVYFCEAKKTKSSVDSFAPSICGHGFEFIVFCTIFVIVLRKGQKEAGFGTHKKLSTGERR